MSKDNFQDLVTFLKVNGYYVKIVTWHGGTSANVSKNDIYGAFAREDNDECSTYITGKIAIDNKKCFDKFSKCPINLPIPTNDKQRKFLLEKMKFFATKEGYKISNYYDYDTINVYERRK